MNTSNKEQPIPTIYTLNEILKITSTSNFRTGLLDGIRDGFLALEKGDFFACPIQTMGAPPMAPFVDVPSYAAQTCVKSGYFRGGKTYVVKVASGGHPHENSGLMQVYSQETGRLEALLLDEGILTELRTAAVGALAARLFAPRKVQMIGILGTGVQARYQLDMLREVIAADDCRNVLIWGRSPSKVKELQNYLMSEETSSRNGGWQVSIASHPDQLLQDCDLIVTTTSAREALLGVSPEALDHLRKTKKGLHITCIGSDSPGKQELSNELIHLADLLVADTVEQTRVRGEFQRVITDGSVSDTSILSLGQAIQNTQVHRTGDSEDNRITIFDSSGVALQDCVVSEMTVKAAAAAAQSGPK